MKLKAGQKILLIGTALTFFSPWVHHLAFLNMKMANTDIDPVWAHWIVGVTLVLTGFVALMDTI